MSKRIAMFFDGTRNTRPDETNVERLYRKVSALPAGPDGRPQIAWYTQGVGTRPTDFFTGAAFGRGVSKNVQVAYSWLRQAFQPNDELFVFGFSRGGFTARSLTGFIAQYGVLRPDARLSVNDLYADYRQPNSAHPVYRLANAKKAGERLTPLEERLLDESTITRIRFIGVWDTVGTIGLPFGHIARISASDNRFHLMEPRMIYDQCCQALAADECRPHYRPILWKRFVLDDKLGPDGRPPADDDLEKRFEQRWFVGAHSNVGGGYKNPSQVYKVPLKWMEDRASAAGLGVADRQQLAGDEHLDRINDSFADFLPYRLAFWTKRQPRSVLRPGEKKVSKTGVHGTVFPLNEVVDETVFDRLKRGGSNGDPYAPANLSHLPR